MNIEEGRVLSTHESITKPAEPFAAITNEIKEIKKLAIALFAVEKELAITKAEKWALRAVVVLVILTFTGGLMLSSGWLFIRGVAQGVSLIFPENARWVASVLVPLAISAVMIVCVKIVLARKRYIRRKAFLHV